MRVLTAILYLATRQKAFLTCCKNSLSAYLHEAEILNGQNEDLKLKRHDNELKEVKKTKHLGLQIASSLDRKEQIKAVLPRYPGQLFF